MNTNCSFYSQAEIRIQNIIFFSVPFLKAGAQLIICYSNKRAHISSPANYLSELQCGEFETDNNLHKQ